MKKIILIPVLLCFLSSVYADNIDSSVYGRPSPIYGNRNTVSTQLPNQYIPYQTNVSTYTDNPVQISPYPQYQPQDYYYGQYQQPEYNVEQYSNSRSDGIYERRGRTQVQYGGNNLDQNRPTQTLDTRGSYYNDGIQNQSINPNLNNYGNMKNLQASNDRSYRGNYGNGSALAEGQSAVQEQPLTSELPLQDRYTDQSDHEMNLKIRSAITNWKTNDYENIAINTSNGKTIVDGYVVSQEAKNFLFDNVRKIQPNASFNVQVRM